MPLIDLSDCHLALIVDCAPAGSLFSHLEVRDLAAEALLEARAALLEADVAGFLDHAERVGDARLLHLLAGTLTGDRLVLADVGERSELAWTVPGRS